MSGENDRDRREQAREADGEGPGGERAEATGPPADTPAPPPDRPRTPLSPADADRRRGDPPPPPLRPGTPPSPAAADRRRGDPPPPWPDPAVVSTSPPPAWSTASTYVGPPPPPPPTYAPIQAAAPAPTRSSARLTALLVAMVIVGLGSGLGVWYIGRDHGGGSGTAGAPVSATTATATATTAPPSTTARDTAPETAPETAPPGTPTAPAGYRLAKDPVGYTLAVPRGWTRRQKQGEKAAVVYYDSPSDGRQLQIFALSESTPAESLDLAENDPGYGYAQEPGFQARGSDSGDTWAELSYRYDDEDKGARQVIDHRFQAADGALYAIRASGPETLPADQVRAPLTTALTSFCPTDASCAA